MKKLGFLICALPLLIAAAAPAAYAGEKGEKKKGDKHHKGTIQGCLSDGASDGWYVLTKQKQDKTKEIQVEGDASFDAHIGHEVKLTGKWKKGDDDSKYFKATDMEHIAATCP